MSETGHHHDCDNHDHGAAHTDPTGAPSPLLVEIRDHLPFSVTAVALGLSAAGAICILGSSFLESALEDPSHDHDHGPTFARLFFHASRAG